MAYLKKYNKYIITIIINICLIFTLLLVETAAARERFTDILPIGKQWIDEEDQENLLPLPIGIDVNFYTHKQQLSLEKISITTTSPGLASSVNGLILNTSTIESTVYTFTASIDIWLFPFVNIYFVGGYADGESSIHVKSLSHLTMTDQELIDSMTLMGIPTSFEFGIDYEGRIMGAGMTFAGGFGSIFGSLDMNYTHTKLDFTDSTIKTINLSPRFGINGSIGPLDGKVWLGGMYQDTTEHIKGEAKFQSIDVNFDVIQEAKDPWNFLVGFQWDITRTWHLTIEAGLGDRLSFYISGEFRF